MSIMEFVKKQYPITYNNAIPLAALVTFILALSGIDFCILPVKTYCSNIRPILYFLAIFCVIVIFAIFLLENMKKFIPSLSGIIEKLIKVMILITNPIKIMWRKFINIIIEGSVLEIIEKKRRSQNLIYTFKKQERDDDILTQSYPLDEKVVEVTLNFLKRYDYWRFGMVFSNSDSFLPGRLSLNTPLFHITKEKQHKNLFIHFYDQGNYLKLTREIEIKAGDEQLTITVSCFNGLVSINIFNKKNKLIYTHKLRDFSFMQLRAWGDGNDFCLPASITSYSLF